MTQYIVNYVAKTVPDSTKLCLIKGSKIKISWGSMSLVCHMFCTLII